MDPVVGEIHLLPINQNQALFSLPGTTYGRNGRSTLARPDLRVWVPIGANATYRQGQQGGDCYALVRAGERLAVLPVAAAAAPPLAAVLA